MDVLNQLEEEFCKRERELRYPLALHAFMNFKVIAEGEQFVGGWGHKQTQEFYALLPKELLNPENEFRVNISLAYILKKIKKHEGKNAYLKVKVWPKVNLYPRANLALNKNTNIYSDIDLFERILVLLCKEPPNNRTHTDEICLWLTLRMIAVDGILIGDADKNISQITVGEVHEANNASWVSVPVGKQSEKSYKQYPVTQRTIKVLKKLKHRALRKNKNGDYLFPESLRISLNKKKTKRRVMLENALNQLCYRIDPEHIQYRKLDIQWWIQMSRQHMEVSGVPYISIANMRNKIRVAQLLFNNEPKKRKPNTYLKNLIGSHELELLREMQGTFKRYARKKVLTREMRHQLKRELQDALSNNAFLKSISPKWQQLFNWFVYLVESNEFSNLSVSTLRTHTYSLPNRFFQYVGVDDLTCLTKNDWFKLAKQVAIDEHYEASSKTTTLTHVRRLYYFLRIKYSGVPEINWEESYVKVHRSIAQGHFILPHSFHEIMSRVNQGSAEWFALFMAYHIGLRCEEIFHLTKQDFDDWERVPVLQSKTDAGYRVVPLASFLTKEQEGQLRLFLTNKEIKHKIIAGSFDYLNSPKDLSKKVARTLRKIGYHGISLHSFRHSFASLQLIRYFSLIDPFLKEHIVQAIPDIPLSLFEGDQIKEFAYVFGGSTWAHDIEELGYCQASPTDLCILSKLLGHTSRQTTLENYCNSFFWLQRYWVLKREAKLMP